MLFERSEHSYYEFAWVTLHCPSPKSRAWIGRSPPTVSQSVRGDPSCLHPCCICYWMCFCAAVSSRYSTSLEKQIQLQDNGLSSLPAHRVSLQAVQKDIIMCGTGSPYNIQYFLIGV